jgi:hypothetical protein
MRNKLFALAAAVTVAGLAAPAFAASVSTDNDEGDNGWTQFTRNAVIAGLQQRGVNATDVERWGQYVRAYVTQPDGTQQQLFFHPTTLTPADPAHLG